MRKHETIADNSQAPRARRKFIMTDYRLSPPRQPHLSPRPHSPAHTEPKPRATKKFIMTDVRLSPLSPSSPRQSHLSPRQPRQPRQPSPSKPRRNFVMTDIELPHQHQPRAHKEQKPRATKKFIMTDYRLSPPRPRSPSKPRRNFVMTDIELHPQYQQQQQPHKPRAVRKFIMTDIELQQLPQPTPRQRRNFAMTDIELPPPLTRPRRIRKGIVKTYKLNKQISYKRGLHILKKISE